MTTRNLSRHRSEPELHLRRPPNFNDEADTESTDSQTHTAKELCVDRDNDRAQRHQSGAHRRVQHNSPWRKDASGERDRHDVAPGSPPQFWITLR
jgi:hypothetical protein